MIINFFKKLLKFLNITKKPKDKKELYFSAIEKYSKDLKEYQLKQKA